MRQSLVITVLTIGVCVSALICPQLASAGWDDKSDELPGIGGVPTLAVVGLGVAAAGFLIWAMSSGDEPASSETPRNDTTEEKKNDSDQSAREFMNSSRNGTQKSPFQQVQLWAAPSRSGVTGGVMITF